MTGGKNVLGGIVTGGKNVRAEKCPDTVSAALDVQWTQCWLYCASLCVFSCATSESREYSAGSGCERLQAS